MKIESVTQRIELRTPPNLAPTFLNEKVWVTTAPYEWTVGPLFTQTLYGVPVAWANGGTGVSVGIRLLSEIAVEPDQTTPHKVNLFAMDTVFYDAVTDTLDQVVNYPSFFEHGSVSWGDGAQTQVEADGPMVSHTYAGPGDYKIEIRWDFVPQANVVSVSAPRVEQLITVS